MTVTPDLDFNAAMLVAVYRAATGTHELGRAQGPAPSRRVLAS